MPKVTMDLETDGLTREQLRAFLTLTSALRKGERIVKLCGYAGSGKTTLLAAIARWAARNGRDVTVAAPTHKAASVIAAKLGGHGIEVRTIHSLLGLILQPDMHSDTGGRILVSQKDARITDGLVICDESSMVGEVLTRHIDEIEDVQWLFVGDPAQLPPVGEGPSELLRDPHAMLWEVVRQGAGSEILELATRIRQGDLSLDFVPGREVSRVANRDGLFQAARAAFVSKEYRADASYARALFFRNELRSRFNAMMRSSIVADGESYVAGEWLIMHSAFSQDAADLQVLATAASEQYGADRRDAWKRFYDEKKRIDEEGSQRLHVSQELFVHAAHWTERRVGRWKFGTWLVDAEDKGGQVWTLPILDTESETQFATAKQELIDEAMTAKREHREQDRKRAWQIFFALEDSFAFVDYAYAMTVHKAQGSTFDHAFVDMQDLMTAASMRQSIIYTAVTRPAKTLTFVG